MNISVDKSGNNLDLASSDNTVKNDSRMRALKPNARALCWSRMKYGWSCASAGCRLVNYENGLLTGIVVPRAETDAIL